jgi:hypothetical protein
LASAFRENVEPGAALQRRASYQFGLALPSSALGEVSGGIGPGIAIGTRSLIAPNREIERTGEQLVIDGVKLVFQLTHGSEAPEELNIDFPEWRTVDLAENANATQHNILTPRGASVRDAKLWADQLTESIERFGDSDILITSHGWPRFGKAEITGYLSSHRDAYAFLHDQTVRLMNQGLTGDEIAARLELPAALDREWYNRPYYGSLSARRRPGRGARRPASADAVRHPRRATRSRPGRRPEARDRVRARGPRRPQGNDVSHGRECRAAPRRGPAAGSTGRHGDAATRCVHREPPGWRAARRGLEDRGRSRGARPAAELDSTAAARLSNRESMSIQDKPAGFTGIGGRRPAAWAGVEGRRNEAQTRGGLPLVGTQTDQPMPTADLDAFSDPSRTRTCDLRFRNSSVSAFSTCTEPSPAVYLRQ